MTLMEIKNSTAGSHKIVGEGQSDSATLLSGFYSKQTHNGLKMWSRLISIYVQRSVTIGSVGKSVIILTCAHVRVLMIMTVKPP